MEREAKIEKRSKITTYFSNFSRAFWVANTVELLERLAYYAVFIVLTLYLSNIWGFSDVVAGVISGIFSAMLYFLPTFAGGYADRIGFRKALAIAFAALTIGYLTLAIFPTLLQAGGLVKYADGTTTLANNTDTVFSGLQGSVYQWSILISLLFIIIGGAFIKSVISGTVAKETTIETRAKGFAIFYMMVNMGAFMGKTVVDPLRRSMGDLGLVYLNYMAASMTFIALILILFLYKSEKNAGEGKSIKEIWKAFLSVLKNGRLIALILIVSGFWIVQGQMYASMPKYVLRIVGETASPGWIANVNPLMVFLFVNVITTLMRKRSALTSITVGMFIIPFSALVMSFGNMMGKDLILGMHPVTLMLILGIAMQAMAECFISPRFLEYFSLQSPKGQEGLYLGFSHLHSFVSYLIAFSVSGVLLEKFCPNPAQERFKIDNVYQKDLYDAATEHAHYLWIVFFCIGLVSAFALIIYSKYVKAIDEKTSIELQNNEKAN